MEPIFSPLSLGERVRVRAISCDDSTGSPDFEPDPNQPQLSNGASRQKTKEALMTKELMDYFNKQPRLGCLSTADENGKVNAAYFGSPRMIDEKTILMGIGKNRTLANLYENPHAAFIVFEPGNMPTDWKGVRLYVKVKEIDTSGPQYQAVKAAIAEKVGKEMADRMIHAAVVFGIEEVRPLVDMGQGWEKSI